MQFFHLFVPSLLICLLILFLLSKYSLSAATIQSLQLFHVFYFVLYFCVFQYSYTLTDDTQYYIQAVEFIRDNSFLDWAVANTFSIRLPPYLFIYLFNFFGSFTDYNIWFFSYCITALYVASLLFLSSTPFFHRFSTFSLFIFLMSLSPSFILFSLPLNKDLFTLSLLIFSIAFFFRRKFFFFSLFIFFSFEYIHPWHFFRVYSFIISTIQTVVFLPSIYIYCFCLLLYLLFFLPVDSLRQVFSRYYLSF